MIKDKKSISHIFVKKFTEKKQYIFTKKEIETLWIRSGGDANRINFAMMLLKNTYPCIRIMRDVYLFHKIENIDAFYWEAIDILAKNTTSYPVILGGEKALEWHMMNKMPPKKLILYTKDTSARIRLCDEREVHFRKLSSGMRSAKKNFFPILQRWSYATEYRRIMLPNPEISLLEALSLNEKNMGNNDALIEQFLDRNHQKLQFSVFAGIAEYRYIIALNRLRSIAKMRGMSDLYENMLMVIKKHGAGCFVSV